MGILKKRISILYLLSIALFIGCDPGELPVKKHEAGGVNLTTIELGPSYEKQAFFNLEENRMVSENSKLEWDLGFESSLGGYRVVLNTSKAMYACYSDVTSFTQPIETAGLNWIVDAPHGNLDSTAFGDWRNKNELIIIDRGYGENNVHLGFVKLRILSVSEVAYEIEFCDLKGTQGHAFSVLKDGNSNFTHVSLDMNGSLHKIEPPKETWDLCFSQYMHIFNEDGHITPYLTTGVLLNRFQTMVYEDTLYGFDSFALEHVDEMRFTNFIDGIGYSWKVFDLANNIYYTNSKKNYIVRDSKGFTYKLRFLDFYNSMGEKGAPTFEYIQL